MTEHSPSHSTETFSQHWVVLGLAVLLIAALTAAFWDYTQDDVFITYTYSRNLAEGQGFVFSPDQRIQGTTTPLYTLFMVGIYHVTDDLLHAGNVLSALFLVGVIGLTLHLTRRYLSVFGQAAFAWMLAASPLVYVSFGMETLLYSLLLVLAFWLWGAERRTAALIVAGALTWTRADGVVLAGACGALALWDFQRDQWPRLVWRKWPWRLAVIYGLVIAPWYIFAWAYFGTPLPNTLGAKEATLSGLTFLADGLGWWRTFYFQNNPLAVLALPLGLIGLWQVWRHARLRVIVVWAVLYTLGYTVLNVSAFWYYTPLFVVTLLLVVFGAEWSVRWVFERTAQRPVIKSVAVGILLISTGLSVARAVDFAEPPGRVTTYRLAGEWINTHTDPDQTLLVGDLGIVGYYARRPTLDTPGLITPQLSFLNHEAYAVATLKPDLVFSTQYFAWRQIIDQSWFREAYRPLASFSTPDDHFSPMIVWERRWPLTTPDTVVQGLFVPATCRVPLAEGERLPDKVQATLHDAGGTVVAQVERPFLHGQYPQPQAAQDETVYEIVALPANISPGEYDWQISCRETGGQVSVLPLEEAAGYVPLEAEWPDIAALQGVYAPHGTATWSGGQLVLVLHWDTLARTPEDYSLFIHLLDASGQLVAQTDGYPRLNQVYSSQWSVPDDIFDLRYFDLPPDLPAGEYQLVIGWYDWRTNTRFPLTDGEDAYPLPLTITNSWPGGSGLP